MNILALNSGSSSLKFKLFQISSTLETVLAEGTVEQLNSEGLLSAAKKAIDSCRQFGIGAVGHRVVHGGARFTQPIRVTPEVIKDRMA